MGRTVICEDGIQEYGAALAAKKNLTVGLMFGQEISSQKSCVIHLARSPEFVDEKCELHEKELASKSSSAVKKMNSNEDFDDLTVLDHVRQVIRALPGGITVLGVFFVSGFDVFQNQLMMSKIRKLLTSIDNIIGKSPLTLRHQLTCERVVLHICCKSLKYTCKTIDIASPIASPKPAEWKFVNAAGSPWIELCCTLNVEFNIGLSDSESSSSLRQQLETGIGIYCKAIKESICIFDSKLLPDSDPLEGPKEKGAGKKKQNQNSSEERMKTINIQVLVPEIETKSEKQECSSDLKFGGQMCIKSYIHSKASVGEACQVIREDILRSLWARCDMHSDSLIGEEQRGQPDVQAVLHEPPRRVLAPLPYSPISVSDYLFPGEGPADSLASLDDLLDLGTLQEGDVQDYWEAAAEVNEALEAECALDSSTMNKQQSTAANSSNSRVILLSGLIALLAIMLSYFTLQIFRSN